MLILAAKTATTSPTTNCVNMGLTIIPLNIAALQTNALSAGVAVHSAWPRFRACGSPATPLTRFRRDVNKVTTKTVPMTVKGGKSSVSLQSWAMRPLRVR